MRNIKLLNHYIQDLEKRGIRITHTKDYSQVIIHDMPLPQDKGIWTDANGQKIQRIPYSLNIPMEFPYSIPGVGYFHPKYGIHIPLILYDGHILTHLLNCQHSPQWYWLCFRELNWNHQEGTLATLVNIVSVSILTRSGYFAD